MFSDSTLHSGALVEAISGPVCLAVKRTQSSEGFNEFRVVVNPSHPAEGWMRP